jgi:Protein of unknown function (DUF2637)
MRKGFMSGRDLNSHARDLRLCGSDSASYEHAFALVRAHGEAGWAGRLVPLTVDGLIYSSSMVMLDSARRKVPVLPLARWLLGLGIAATLAANVAHGLGQGSSGAVVAAWPAVALVGSYELLMVIIRSAQVPAGTAARPGTSGEIPEECVMSIRPHLGSSSRS